MSGRKAERDRAGIYAARLELRSGLQIRTARFLWDRAVICMFRRSFLRPEHFQQKCEAVLRTEMRKNKKVEGFRDSEKSGNSLRNRRNYHQPSEQA
ncbi:MAG: hypothetical protein DI528_16650 [Shinella sp.]|nr:MAG: hypothetical protein DI528_16650 [Shinella sp.]